MTKSPTDEEIIAAWDGCEDVYRCKDCDHISERQMLIEDDDAWVMLLCPSCGSDNLIRITDRVD